MLYSISELNSIRNMRKVVNIKGWKKYRGGFTDKCVHVADLDKGTVHIVKYNGVFYRLTGVEFEQLLDAGLVEDNKSSLQAKMFECIIGLDTCVDNINVMLQDKVTLCTEEGFSLQAVLVVEEHKFDILITDEGTFSLRRQPFYTQVLYKLGIDEFITGFEGYIYGMIKAKWGLADFDKILHTVVNVKGIEDEGLYRRYTIRYSGITLGVEFIFNMGDVFVQIKNLASQRVQVVSSKKVLTAKDIIGMLDTFIKNEYVKENSSGYFMASYKLYE